MLFAPSPLKQQAADAYMGIVAQSRQPVFYTDWQVPDTLDGRFDVLVLHLFLVLARCEDSVGEDSGPAGATSFSRALAEMFFADMDRSLREMGAGDTGVGRRVKAMAEAFYGRMQAYRRRSATKPPWRTRSGAMSIAKNRWRPKPPLLSRSICAASMCVATPAARSAAEGRDVCFRRLPWPLPRRFEKRRCAWRWPYRRRRLAAAAHRRPSLALAGGGFFRPRQEDFAARGAGRRSAMGVALRMAAWAPAMEGAAAGAACAALALPLFSPCRRRPNRLEGSSGAVS